ncbi:MAG: hypothetical protein Q8914_10475 [Bacteroidota bacterium]|nr:hypothetical protein [Bacteroidota bacterium]
MIRKLKSVTFVLGAVLILVSSVLVMEHVQWGKYAFAIGAALYIINRKNQNYEGFDFRLRRLNRFNFINSILLVVISYLQFKDRNYWVILLLIVAILEMYATFRAEVYEKDIAKKESEPASEVEPESQEETVDQTDQKVDDSH